MMKKTIAIICGGQSEEHEVSLVSAKSIVKAIIDDFNILLVIIDKNGVWHDVPLDILLQHEDYTTLDIESFDLLTITKNKEHALFGSHIIDVAFPIIHGTTGEDGKIQGLLEILNIPYVGSGVDASLLCMDKVLTKKMLSEFLCVPYVVLNKRDLYKEMNNNYLDISSILGSNILFVKPSNLGSSVGVSKVSNQYELDSAVLKAFEYSEEILVEKAINAREIEIAVLGKNYDNLIISEPCEIIPNHEFYSYEAKYLDANSASFVTPADITKDMTNMIKNIARDVFQILRCSGMARIDFFVCKDTNHIYLNEVNTIPGFTPISMYPKLIINSGISYSELILKLIDLALKK